MKPATKTLSIPISGPLRAFIEGRVRSRGFNTVSEYIRSLVRLDQERAAQEELEAKLLQAVERGEYRQGDDALWDRLRQRADRQR